MQWDTLSLLALINLLWYLEITEKLCFQEFVHIRWGQTDAFFVFSGRNFVVDKTSKACWWWKDTVHSRFKCGKLKLSLCSNNMDAAVSVEMQCTLVLLIGVCQGIAILGKAFILCPSSKIYALHCAQLLALHHSYLCWYQIVASFDKLCVLKKMDLYSTHVKSIDW